MLEKHIVGQRKIKEEAKAIVESLKTGKNLNLLFSGRSGTGKTHLVTAMANDLDLDNFILYLDPSNYKINEQKRFHVFDEAHLIVVPELIYPYMDNNTFTFFFLTNYYGELKEPLRNRCIHLQLQPYSLEEIADIICRNADITEEAALYLSKFCKNTPRVAIKIAQRMEILLKRTIGKEDIIPLLYILGINQKGLNEDDKMYLTSLNKAGGTASLELLSKLTGFDKKYITEIEAYLVEKGIIRITGRGRKLI